MNRPPEPPPEGVLIESARRDAGLSVREAARRAGISEGWWRQVVKGYQSLSGGAYGVVRGVPAETVARMASATKRVTPEQMESEGERPDAAGIMRREAHAVPDSPPEGWLTKAEVDAAQPYADLIVRRLFALERKGIEHPAGEDVFPDEPRWAQEWDESGKDVDHDKVAQMWLIADARTKRDAARQEAARRRGTGLNRSNIADQAEQASGM